VRRRLLEKKIVAGVDISPFYAEFPEHYLLCATETNTREDMDALIEEVGS